MVLSSSSMIRFLVVILASACIASSETLFSMTTVQQLSSSTEQFNITENGTIQFSRPIQISSYTIQSGNKPSQFDSGVFISNIPNERLQLVVCGEQDHQLPLFKQITHYFGDLFKEGFAKKNFTSTIEESINCTGLNLLYRRISDDRKILFNDTRTNQQILKNLQSNLNSLIVSSEIPPVTFNNTNRIQLELSNAFEIEFLADKVATTNNIISKPSIYSMISSMSYDVITSVSTQQPVIINNQFKIISNQILNISDKNINTEFIAYFYRTASGNGLHQKNTITFQLEIKNQLLVQSGANCELAIVDYLDNTQYVDIDELNLHENLDMFTYTVHNIEKPSGQSPQLVYLLKYKFKESDIQMSPNQKYAKLSMNETYLIHYRYRTPANTTFKSSYVNAEPLFLINCLQDSKVEPTSAPIALTTSMTYNSFAARLANSKFNPTETKFTQIQAQPANIDDTLHRLVPVGYSIHKDLTLYVTIAVTISACLFFSAKIIQLAKKYNL